MDKRLSPEAKILHSLPAEPRKRMRRVLTLGFVGSAALFLIFGGTLSGLRENELFHWTVGGFFLLLSFIFWISSPVWMGEIQHPGRYYLIYGFVRIPIFGILLGYGLSLNATLLPAASARWIILGLLGGLVFLPFAIKRRLEWTEESLKTGNLKKCLNAQKWTWDPAHDMDHIRKDPRKMRPGIFWRLVFWSGPVVGFALADIFGRLNALLIVGLLTTLIGYLAIISIGIISFSFYQTLTKIEKGKGQKLILDSEESS